MKIFYLTIILMLNSVMYIVQQPADTTTSTVQSKESVVVEKPKEKVTTKVEEKSEEKQVLNTEEKPILILINESSPDQMIIFDSNGVWLDSIKSGTLELEIGTGKITATLLSWKGVIKPKNPKTSKYKVKELKSVTSVEFENQLEQLNK